MQIISKKDRALQKLQVSLLTFPRSAEARAKVKHDRRVSNETGVCTYCNTYILHRSTRHEEACNECGKAIGRLLTRKSKLVNGECTRALVENFIEDYESMVDWPYSLCGTGIAEAAHNLREVMRELSREDLRKRLDEQRKAEIRANLRALGMQPGPEMEAKVEDLVNN